MTMASSNLTYQTSPGASSNEEVPIVRKVKKIKNGLVNVSSILNAMSETCDTTNNDNDNNNDNDKINVIQKHLVDDSVSVDKVTDETEENNICEGDCTCQENEKCGYYYRNRDKKLEYQKKYNREQGDKIKNYNKDYYQKKEKKFSRKRRQRLRASVAARFSYLI